MKKHSLIILTAAAAFFSGNAYSAGFQLSESSVAGLGRAFGGAGIMGDDLSAIAYNPAGLSLIHQKSVQIGGTYVGIKSRFRNGKLGGTPIQNTDPNGDAVVPYFYAAMPINDKLTTAIGVFAPFGLGTEYYENWGGRSHAIMTDVMTVNINPSISYKLNDQWSFGAGINAQRASGELTSNPVSPVKVAGDDWGFGWNAGFMWSPVKQARIGLSYRSQIDFGLTGKMNEMTPVSLDITIPQYAILSGAYDVNNKATVSAMVRWTDWSVFDKLEIKNRTNGATISSIPENWRDTWTFGLGLDYKFTNKFTGRIGAAYDMTVIENLPDRTARIPDNTRKWLTMGASYDFGSITVDAAYSHIFIHNAGIANNTGYPQMLTGLYKSHADLFGLSATIKF